MFVLKKLTVALFVACLMPLISVGQVIPNDAVLFDTPGGSFGDYQLALGQSIPEGEGLFGVGVRDLGNDEFGFASFGIAQQYALFSAEPGDSITPDFVSGSPTLTTNFFAGISGPSSLTLSVGESVFLSYWDDRGPGFLGNGLADQVDNYGWLELGRSDRLLDGTFGELEILGGATAIGQGIIVGTTTTIAIPEPSSAVLLSLFAAPFVARRKK